MASSHTHFSLEWLHQRLGRKWSADALSSLLDAPLLARLAELWPAIPHALSPALKPRVLLELTCLKAPIAADVAAGARRLLEVAAADGTPAGAWGRVVAGLVARSCPVLFSGAEPPAALTAAADAAIADTLAAVLSQLAAADGDDDAALPLLLSELPIELRLFAPSAAVEAAWDYRRGVHFSVSEGSGEAARVAVRDTALREAAAAVWRTEAAADAEAAASAAALALVSESEDGGGGAASSTAAADPSLAAETAAAAAVLDRASYLLLAYVRGGDDALGVAAAAPSSSSLSLFGSVAGDSPLGSASGLHSAGGGGGGDGAGAPFGFGGGGGSGGSARPSAQPRAVIVPSSISYKRHREAPEMVDGEVVRAAKRAALSGGGAATSSGSAASRKGGGGASAATAPVSSPVTAAAAGVTSVTVSAKPAAAPLASGGAGASHAPASTASSAAASASSAWAAASSSTDGAANRFVPAASSPAATAAADVSIEASGASGGAASAAPAGGADTAAAPPPPPPTLSNPDALIKRVSEGEAPLLSEEGRAAVMRFVDKPRGGAPMGTAATGGWE